MDAPKCKFCGEKHWERICPKFKKPPKVKNQIRSKKPVVPRRHARSSR